MNLSRAISLTMVRAARVELAPLPWQSSAYGRSAKPAIVEVGVGFEPTDGSPPSVFETDAISQALPTYRGGP